MQKPCGLTRVWILQPAFLAYSVVSVNKKEKKVLHMNTVKGVEATTLTHTLHTKSKTS